MNKIKNFAAISLLSLIPTLLVWLPFFLRFKSFWGIPLPVNGMETIVANYDGPLYMVVAKTLYNKSLIAASFQFPLPVEYYTAHFPLYPLLIKLVGIAVNYPYAMLIVTLMSSFLAIFFFNKLASLYLDKKNALFLTLLFSFLPARWLAVRSVGSADPLFVAAIIASLYYFKDKKLWLSALWGVIATITKSPGILLFGGYFIYYIVESIKNRKINFDLKKTYPLLAIPASLVAVFVFYYFRTGDFFAYFHSGDNIHLSFIPFQIFNYSASWIGTYWLEEILFIYAVGAMGVIRLFQKKEYELASFTALFYSVILFVGHRDLIRYFLPAVPFIFIAYSDILVKKEFKIVAAILIIPVYLFTLGFVSQNVMPISNWAPFL